MTKAQLHSSKNSIAGFQKRNLQNNICKSAERHQENVQKCIKKHKSISIGGVSPPGHNDLLSDDIQTAYDGKAMVWE